MNLTDFAEKHKLKTRKDACGETVIPGRLRTESQIYQYSETELGLLLSPEAKTPGKWTGRIGVR